MSWLDEFTDNLAVVNAAAADAIDVRNWFTGEAPRTAAIVEEQIAERENRPVSQARIDASAKGGLGTIKDAGAATVNDVAEKAKEAGTFLGKWGPWILGGAAVLAVGVIALPYVSAAKGLIS